ncbi:MAG TPA: NAD(P)-dependent oxidoreductase [Desulfobacterales bacterium]|nr:NAD(P)-dependent oxidoreductase [Desulfobacterales bacterium]
MRPSPGEPSELLIGDFTMKCLVTGGSGFIGSHLVQKLLESDHEVAVLDLRQPFQDVEWLELDIRDKEKINLKGFQVVYHLAALSNARRSSELPNVCYITNVLGTLNIVQAALRDGVERVILASSSWVAGAQCGDVINEKIPFNLLDVNTVYGASKLAQEMICYSYLGEFGGPSFTVLRYGIPYGERMWRGLVVRAFMEMAERTGTINIMGDGKQYREFLYVGDMCDGQVLALAPIAENKVYNLTGDRPITVEELAKEVAKYFPAELNYIPQARVEPKLKRIQNDLAKSELGWNPSTTLAEGIQMCAEWWKSLSEEQKSEKYWI